MSMKLDMQDYYYINSILYIGQKNNKKQLVVICLPLLFNTVEVEYNGAPIIFL